MTKFMIGTLVVILGVLGGLLYSLNEVVEDSGSLTTVKIEDSQLGSSTQCLNIQPENDSLTDMLSAGHTIDYREDVWYIDDIPVGYAVEEDEHFALCADTELMNEWFGN